jgi:putative membrane protein
VKTKPYNIEYSQHYKIPEWESNLVDELRAYLSEEERQYVLEKKNRATQILALQSKQLKELHITKDIDALCYVEMENVLKDFYEHQGKSERIKNFPYPRQFSSINLYFTRLLVYMLPFGMLNEFAKLGEYGVWLTIPFSVIVGWVFVSLEQVGESTENPFEGGANDIPITSMSRTIEIDLREMLDETDLPPAISAENNILM